MKHAPTSIRSRRSVRIVGAIVGLLLFAAAVTAVSARTSDLHEVAAAVRTAPAWAFALLALSVGVSPVLTAVSFSILTRRYGLVGRGEMVALILSAWLLNYLPLWPGMMSRIAYHKAVNGIAVTDSARVILQAGVLCGTASLMLAGLMLGIARPLGMSGLDAVAVGAAGAVVPAIIALRLRGWAEHPHAWRYAAVLGVRTLELGVWSARYALTVTIVGGSVSPGGALIMAALVQLAVLIPLAPNGLGVREWAIGLSASAFAIGMTANVGLAAGVLDRGIEGMIAVPLGLISAAALGNKRRKAGLLCAPSTDANSA